MKKFMAGICMVAAFAACAKDGVVKDWTVPVQQGKYYSVSVKSAETIPASDYTAFLEWDNGKKGFRRTLLRLSGKGWTGGENAPSNAVKLTARVCCWNSGAKPPAFEFAFNAEPARQPRKVRMGIATQMPASPATLEANRQVLLDTIKRAASLKVELLCMTECLIDRGVPGTLLSRSFTVDDPFLQQIYRTIGEAKIYCVFSFHERRGEKVYNTAVLIGPDGKRIGQYSKRHLALAELEEGIVSGTESPVFDTPIGRIGMAICWDMWFPETVTMLAESGAEIVCFPLAGDIDTAHWDSCWRARAIDGGVVILSSLTKGCATHTPSRIVTPDGQVRAETYESNGIAWADVEIPQKVDQFWLSVGPYWADRGNVFQNSRLLLSK